MKNVDSRSAVMASIIAALTTAAQATVIIVPTQQPTIQAAINAAGNGDTVLVLDGTYTGPGNRDIDFLGKTIILQSQGGPQSCIIDVAATPASQHSAFYLHLGENNAAVIQGFTVKRGWEFNGPGMMLINSSPTVRDCVFTENNADCWGGVVYYDGNASPQFINCRFINNYAADDGGAVFGFDGSPTFTNCVIANNIAPTLGGAIFSYGSTGSAPKLINCTVTGNFGGYGAAVASNNLVIENSIVWNNTGDDQQIYTWSTNSITVRYSNVQAGFAGVGNINVAPQFVDAPAGDFHLAPGSSCIDAGDPDTVVPEGTLDCDGDPRRFGVRIDMGYEEYRRAGDVNGDHITNVDDLLLVLNAWGPCTWSTADFDHDFAVDVNDMLMVINNWS